MTAFKQSGGSSGPTGAAGGELAGTFPNPTLKDGVVDDANIKTGGLTDAAIAAANKDGLAAAPSLRTLGTGAQQAVSGTDTRLPPTPSAPDNTKVPTITAGVYTLKLPKVAVRYFFVSQYSPFNDLVNSDTAAIQAAINDCIAQGGGIVVLDHVDFYLNASGGVFGLTWPADFTGHLTIQGLGEYATSVRLGPRNKTFISGDTSYTTNAHTYQNLTVQDLTINARNLNGTDNATTSGLYGAVFGTQGRCNYANLAFKRIRTVNMGPNLSVGRNSTDGITGAAITRERRNIDITISTTPEGALGANAFTIDNIIVEDCKFGASGGGGNVGVVITAFHGDATSSQRFGNYIYNTPYLSNTQITNVRISRCWHDPGSPANDDATSVTATSGAFGALNFMIGQAAQGYNWLIEDCYGANSADVGIEVDSGLNTIVRNCYMKDAFDAGYYHANIGAGADTAGYSNPQQHTKFINCRSLHTMACSGSFPPPSEAFTIAQPKFASPFGHVSLIDCEAIRTPNGTWNPSGGQLVEFRGNHRSINIKNLHTSETYSTSDTTARTSSAVAITTMSGRCQVNIDGFHDELVGSPTGTTTNAFTRNVLAFTNGADVMLDVRGVTYRHQWRATNGHKLTSNGVKLVASTDFTDTFGSGSQSINRDYVLDAGGGVTGAVTDITQTATLNSVSNTSTEQRFIYVIAAGNGSWTGTGPFTDQSFSIKSTPGATISGHKTGIILKRRPEDATYYLECYVTDDGAQSLLKIDKILAGVRTNLAVSSALSTRISNGTAYWVRGMIRGNVVTADYFTGTPGALSASGEETLTFTLLTTDIEKLGDVRQGWGGFSWVSKDTAATLDDFSMKRMGVYGGRGFSGIQPLEVSGPASAVYGFTNGLLAGSWRALNRIRFRDCDFTHLKGNTQIAEFRYSDGDTAMQAVVDARGIGYATTPPAATTPTVGASPYTYTNSDGRVERVGVYGGTVSAISITDVGGTTTQLAGATDNVVTLEPGEALVITYTVAPTVKVVPQL